MPNETIRLLPENNAGKRVEVTITYLEQTARPALLQPPRPRQKTAFLRAHNPPVHFYRYLYRRVGDPYNWVSRRRMSDGDLKSILSNPDIYIYVFYVDGAPAGFAEIDATDAKTHELKFFGLMPDYTGSGLGRFFLTNVIDLAWSHGPERVRLETCTLDHPAALPLYQRFGFTVFDQRKGVVELMDTSPPAN